MKQNVEQPIPDVSGALVGPTSPIVVLIPPALEVAINVDEAQLGSVSQGQSVALQVPAYLALMGDCDGPAHELLAELARRADAGLRRIFSHCTG